MGAIIEFPAEAASRRLGSSTGAAQREGMATILIERDADGGRGPEEGTAPGRRRRRRARS
jgi:hypothetical protein